MDIDDGDEHLDLDNAGSDVGAVVGVDYISEDFGVDIYGADNGRVSRQWWRGSLKKGYLA